MSYTKLLYHIVLRTYRSKQTINTNHERELYGYMMGIIERKGGKLYRIGGMPDHIHLLLSLPTTQDVASFVQELKKSTNRWLKANPNFPDFYRWSKEYAAFTYAEKDKNMIVNYIKGQKEHHRKVSFQEEYRSFLVENAIIIKEDYFLRD